MNRPEPPEGSIVVDEFGRAYQRDDFGGDFGANHWWAAGYEQPSAWGEVQGFRPENVTIVWIPNGVTYP